MQIIKNCVRLPSFLRSECSSSSLSVLATRSTAIAINAIENAMSNRQKERKKERKTNVAAARRKSRETSTQSLIPVYGRLSSVFCVEKERERDTTRHEAMLEAIDDDMERERRRRRGLLLPLVCVVWALEDDAKK